MNMKKSLRMTGIVSAAMLLAGTFAVPSFAYIERGNVEISGDTSYVLEIGETAELSISPYEEEHLPGCQMPECPEICGEKECIVYYNDGVPECVCAGTEFQTYYAEVSTSSSDTSVAEVSCSGGTVTITAVGQGTADITITADFREYTGADKTVLVTVNPQEPAGGASSGEAPEQNSGENPDSEPSESTGGSSGGSSVSGGSAGGSSSGGSAGGAAVQTPDPVEKPSDNGETSEKPEETLGENKPETPETQMQVPVFSDVSGWAAEYISELAARGIVNGRTATTFEPSAAVTRAEFIKIIAGVACADLSAYKVSDFADVSSEVWYSPAVAWAAENGIVQGSDGKFYPNAQITRQDMAVILTRYLEKIGNITLPEKQEAQSFQDEDQISDYAKSAVTAMQRAGIINGKGDGIFAPKASATRAETCKMTAEILRSMES